MNFYVTGGSLQSNAPSYVEREADRQLLKSLLEGEFCYVLTARQMGKSSLMVRTASRLRAMGIHVSALDLTAIGGQNVTPEQWYHGLLDMLGQMLDLEDKLELFWQANSQLGPLRRFMKALRQVVLGGLEGEAGDSAGARASAGLANAALPVASTQVRLVIFVDEVDFVRSLPFHTDEFFAAIRECYNHRTLDPAYHRLTFCLLGVASPSDLIRDTRTTPFNIGHCIELNDFTPEEAAPLAAGLQGRNSENPACPPGRSAELLARILYWTEGHPYLTQRLCRQLAETLEKNGKTPQNAEINPAALVDQICASLFFCHRAHEHDDNLIFVRERLLGDQTERAGLLELYLKIWQGKRVVDDELDPLITQLRLSGVVRVREGRLRKRNAIYARVFGPEWVRANMPQAELRRQRDAYRRGVFWVLSVSAVMISALGLLSLVAMRQASESNLNQAKAWRLSGRTGGRTNALVAIQRARRWGMVFGARQELRDEAVAVLSLVHLREPPLGIDDRVPETNVFELNNTFSRYAIGDRDGRIQLFSRKSKKPTMELSGFGLPVQWMHFDPNDRFLAAGYGRNGVEEHRCVVWSLSNGSKVLDFAEPVLKEAVDFSRDGSLFAVGFKRQHVQVYDLIGPTMLFESPEDKVRTEDDYPVMCVRFDPAGRQVAESSKGGLNVDIWNIAKNVSTSYEHPAEVVHLDWGPDGTQLATACQNGDIYLFRHVPDNAKERLYRTGLHDLSPTVRFNRSGTLLAAACSDSSLRLWRPWSDRELLATFDLDRPTDPRFSTDGRQLSVTTPSGRFRLFNVEGGPELITLGGSRGSEAFQSVGFHPSGRVLIAAGPSSLWFWDFSSPQSRLQTNLPGLTLSTAFDHSGTLVAATGSGLFELPLKVIHQSDADHLDIGSVIHLNYTPGLGPLALATNGTVAVIHRRPKADQIDVFRLCDLENASPLRRLQAQPTFVCNSDTRLKSVTVTPNGQWLFASPNDEQDVLAWNLVGTDFRRADPIPQARYVAVSPSGKWIVTSWHGEFQFREIGSWSKSPLRIPQSSTYNGYSPLAFGPLSNKGECLVAAATSPFAIELFRFRDGNLPKLVMLTKLETPNDFPVTCLFFDATGGRLAAGTAAQIVQIWDLAQIRKELDALRLATGFPELPEAASSNHLQFVVDTLNRSAEEETASAVRDDRLNHIAMLTERIKDLELTGDDVFEDLFERAGRYGEIRCYDLALADLNRALRFRPNDEKVKKVKAAFEWQIQSAPKPLGQPSHNTHSSSKV
jgi:WD40 repeat protein